jgi:hypothetical protein
MNQRSLTETSGPDMTAFITAFPSSLLPARVVLNALMASLKANLETDKFNESDSELKTHTCE